VNDALYVPLTQNDPVYFCTLTSMPQYPGFEIPTTPLETATFKEVGNADDKGVVRFCKDSEALPMAVHGEITEGRTVLPWNARFITSSAYTPPSPEWLMSCIALFKFVIVGGGETDFEHDAILQTRSRIASSVRDLDVQTKNTCQCRQAKENCLHNYAAPSITKVDCVTSSARAKVLVYVRRVNDYHDLSWELNTFSHIMAPVNRWVERAAGFLHKRTSRGSRLQSVDVMTSGDNVWVARCGARHYLATLRYTGTGLDNRSSR